MNKPQNNSNHFNKLKFVRLLFFIAILIWCIGFSIQVLFPDSQFTALLYPFLKYNYGLVCHQNPAKVILIGGHKLLVCARCTGIYLGALITSLFSLIAIKRTKLKLIFFLIPLLMIFFDVLLSTLNVYHYSKLLAMFTGLLFGSVVFIYILNSVEKYFSENKNK